MSRRLLFCVLSFFYCLFSGFKGDLEKKIIGVWIINAIYYHDQNLKSKLSVNTITIKKNQTCSLPVVEVTDKNSPKTIGYWKIMDKDSVIIIQTPNEIFAGRYTIKKMRLEHDTIVGGESLKMMLISEGLKLYCSKSIMPEEHK